MITDAEIRRNLTRALDETPVRDKACAELRQQLHDQLEIAARSMLAESFEDCARACGFAQSAAQALQENQEMEAVRLSDLATFTGKTLVDAALKDALDGDKEAKKAILEAARKLQKKEAPRGRS